jgi:hypothetical protein
MIAIEGDCDDVTPIRGSPMPQLTAAGAEGSSAPVSSTIDQRCLSASRSRWSQKVRQ